MPVRCSADSAGKWVVLRQGWIRWPGLRMATGAADPELANGRLAVAWLAIDWPLVQGRLVSTYCQMTSNLLAARTR